jgi:hypothetical protein
MALYAWPVRFPFVMADIDADDSVIALNPPKAVSIPAGLV